MLHKCVIGVACLVTVIFSNSHGAAQEKLRLAWAGFSPTNSPIWVIEDRKLLQKMGVQPEIIAISASPTVLQALLANEIDAASISVTTLTSSRLAGADTVMIVGVVPTFVDHIVSLSSMTAVEQLKGKTAALIAWEVLRISGLRLALRKLGIEPDKDVKIIPTGGTAERFAALSKGITQFTIIPEPFLTQAEKLGFRNLYNISDLKIPFWWNGILSREGIVKAKRPLMLKLARAMVEAMHIIKTDKEYAISLCSKRIWALPIRKDWRERTKTIRTSFRKCPIPLRTASRPCSTIWRARIQRPQLQTPKHSLIRASSRNWTPPASSSSANRTR